MIYIILPQDYILKRRTSSETEFQSEKETKKKSNLLPKEEIKYLHIALSHFRSGFRQSLVANMVLPSPFVWNPEDWMQLMFSDQFRSPKDSPFFLNPSHTTFSNTSPCSNASSSIELPLCDSWETTWLSKTFLKPKGDKISFLCYGHLPFQKHTCLDTDYSQ